MKRFCLWLLGTAFVVGLIPLAAWAYYEPPHFSEPPVDSDCFDCHILNPHHGFSTYPAKLNSLCQSCHFDGGPATGVLTHSSLTTDADYGNWDLDCWACHNPHSQEQESWISTTYGKYIRKNLNAEIKEIDPAEPGPYYPPLSIIRTVTSDIVEFKGPTEFVDGDGEANDDICQVCHQQTSYYNTGTELNYHDNYGAESQPGGICTNCHTHENGFRASGGHPDPDTNIVEATNCTTAGCHDGTITGTWTPVADIHNSDCSLCHVDPAGGGALWEPWETNNTNGGDCEDCHNGGTGAGTVAARASIHHNFKYATTGSFGPAGADGQAINGLCISCHMPDIDGTGPIANRGDITMPANLACNYCHLYFAGFAADPDNNTGYATSGSKIVVYGKSFNPNLPVGSGGNWGRLPTVTPLATHTISEAATPISDYGACFACHGGSIFLGTNGLSTSIEPFHGMGTPYTNTADNGNRDNAGTGGDLDDVNNAYTAPQVTLFYPDDESGYNPAPTVGFHPGWDNLNWLACEIGWSCGATKPYSNDESPGWHQPKRLLHGDASGNFTPGACSTGNYDIPWDSFTVGDPGTPTTMSKDFGWRGINSSLTVNVPLVAADMAGCTLWNNDPITYIVGIGDGTGKGGADAVDDYAYVDLNNPYPVSAPNNGTVTEVIIGQVQDAGIITVFACTPDGAGNCDVTGSYDFSFGSGADETTGTISPGLTIEPGGVIGFWHTGAQGTVDLGNDTRGSTMQITTGTVSKPAANDSLPITDDGTATHRSNLRAIISAKPF
jgi:hypothetical protein